MLGWVNGFHDAMARHATGGVYVNLLGAAGDHRIHAAYGENHGRLTELKKKWDPTNLFRANYNIEPSG